MRPVFIAVGVCMGGAEVGVDRLEVTGLTRRFPGLEAPVLDGLALTVAAGEAVAIVGPSGSGKSTLLGLLGLLDDADGGTIRLDGEVAPAAGTAEAERWRRERLGFVFQDHRLLPALDALGNVLLPALAERSRPTDAQVVRARSLLAQLGLADRAAHRPAALSAGQRQRTAIARALLRSPRLVLADEPTGALDATSARQVVDALREQQGGASLIVVTHDPVVAARMDRVLALRDGRLVPA